MPSDTSGTHFISVASVRPFFLKASSPPDDFSRPSLSTGAMAGLQTDTDALAGISHAEKNLGQEKSRTFSSDYSHDNKYDPEVPVQDGIHDGLEFPTDEEKMTLRRVTDTIPWNAYRE